MRTLFFILIFAISSFGFAQNNHIVKTEDGRRVLLKADFTWEYIDNVKPNPDSAPVKKEAKLEPTLGNGCNLSRNFEEPRLNNKIQAQLKRSRATMKHIKQKAAKDNNCNVEDVILLSVSETKKNGVYDFCANGVKVRYKRMGSAITKPLNIF